MSEPCPAVERQLWLHAREGQRARDIVAEVAFRLPDYRTYALAVPDRWLAQVTPGVRVVAPYGRSDRRAEAWVIDVSEQAWDHTRKALVEVDSAPPMPAALLQLGVWIADYYVCPIAVALDAIAPVLAGAAPKSLAMFRATGQVPARVGVRQRQALEALAGGALSRAELAARAQISGATLRSLLEHGAVQQTRVSQPAAGFVAGERRAAHAGHCPEDDFVLTEDQARALDTIVKALAPGAPWGAFLLFGAPGSGKTEVYVRAIRAAIERQLQAILLVPEIALATQVADRLMARFARVAVWHSRMSRAQRRQSAAAIRGGAVDVVIGTRTAVFAPLARLGLIVVDEEQEGSYKNLSRPYYHARDVAIKRGQLEGACVLLGSATPALETWQNAQRLPHFRLLRTPRRVPGATLPDARLIDCSRPALGQESRVLSPELERLLRDTLAEGKQAILLHNRRGYAARLQCRRCGLTASCERCGAALVYHSAEDLLKCHRCGLRREKPETCLDDTCGGELTRATPAIQRLEAELRAALPAARLSRLDRDTMRRLSDYAQALRGFAAGDADILLGTQMIAKGLDFPNVALVGVIDADAPLRLPDFRANEHAFQLLAQVVGRAGRGAGASHALLQASETAHPVLRDVLALDYESFARRELESRRGLLFPPFWRLIRFVCADARRAQARDGAAQLEQALRAIAGRVNAAIQVDEAAPCVIARVRDLFRYEVVLRAPRDGSAQRVAQQMARARRLRPRTARFTIDVDPIDVL